MARNFNWAAPARPAPTPRTVRERWEDLDEKHIILNDRDWELEDAAVAEVERLAERLQARDGGDFDRCLRMARRIIDARSAA